MQKKQNSNYETAGLWVICAFEMQKALISMCSVFRFYSGPVVPETGHCITAPLFIQYPSRTQIFTPFTTTPPSINHDITLIEFILDFAGSSHWDVQPHSGTYASMAINSTDALYTDRRAPKSGMRTTGPIGKPGHT